MLKFGGSVLLDEQRLRIAVHEIYRWRREGMRVVAVVSALAGRTDELIVKCATLSDSASRLSKASLIAAGENESASLLGVHLDRAGLSALVLSPASIEFVANGDPLNANPLSVNVGKLEVSLEENGIVVVPGFVAINESGATVTLGRGGSDLSAVFLANALKADRCRLIKDVDGLYEHDPAGNSPPPRRFKCAGYGDALDTDGSIIQHKAVEYAKLNRLEFELGGFNSVFPTLIGSLQTKFDDEYQECPPTSVTICGLGTVGGGVVELITQIPDQFTIDWAGSRSPEKYESQTKFVGSIQDDVVAIAGYGSDVVLELIGGVDTAAKIARCAIQNGSHVITANKTLIANMGICLVEEASRAGVTIRYSASVGGAAPILENVQDLLNRVNVNPIRSLRGVLNGTGNFVLGSLSKGISYEESIAEAQRRGFAEADPSRDIDGRDSLDKLLVIAQEIGWKIDPLDISLSSISDWVDSSRNLGFPVRHVARIDAKRASVLVESIGTQEKADPLSELENEWNAVVIEFEDESTLVVRGKGAGRWPTSESVLADLLELRRNLILQTSAREVINV